MRGNTRTEAESSPMGPQTPAGRSSSMADETSGDMRGGGGLAPGGYYFYAYTGELRGGRFVADEKSLLGRFMCSVEDDK